MDLDASRGAVASLMAGDDHLTQLPDPNIPNATWYAIAGNYQAAQPSIPSTVEVFNNTFYKVFYPQPIHLDNPPPPTGYMMTDSPDNPTTACSKTSSPIFRQNDSIVPLCSQIWHAIPGQTVTIPGLAHTDISGLGSLMAKFGNSVDAPSVTASDIINKYVSYYLGYQAAPVQSNAVTRTQSPLSFEAPAFEAPSSSPTLFDAGARVIAQLPDGPVKLGQPVRIPFDFTEGNVGSFSVTQFDSKGEKANSVGESTKIVEDNASSKTIEIFLLSSGN